MGRCTPISADGSRTERLVVSISKSADKAEAVGGTSRIANSIILVGVIRVDAVMSQVVF